MFQLRIAQADCPSALQVLLTGTNSQVDQSSFDLSGEHGRFKAVKKEAAGKTAVVEQRRVDISPGPVPATQALQFSVGADDPLNAPGRERMQKINYDLLFSHQSGDLGLEIGQTRYVGFNLKVDRPALEGTDTITLQAWQGAPHTPPLAFVLHWEGDGSASLAATFSSTFTGSNPTAKRSTTPSILLKPHTWYSLLIGLKPKIQTDSVNSIELSWKRYNSADAYMIGFVSKLPWGYDPDSSSCPYAGKCDVTAPNRQIDLLIGLYRRADSNDVKVSFENIKVGTTKMSADPALRCTIKP